MTKPIKVFGNSGSPYTQKILSLLRYRNIPYTVSWGDVIHNLSLLDIEPPKPVLLPTMIFDDGNEQFLCKTDTTPIIRYLEDIYTNKSVLTSYAKFSSALVYVVFVFKPLCIVVRRILDAFLISLWLSLSECWQ